MIKRKIKATKIPRNNNLELDKQLEQLKILYSELTFTASYSDIFSRMKKTLKDYFDTSKTYKKDCYPKEDYEAFVVRMIDKKKVRIEEELDVWER